MDLLPRFQELTEAGQILLKSQKILVGFSGGPDSTALLDLLYRGGWQVIAAHLNHGQRPEAADEERACAVFCEARKISLVIGHGNVPLLAEDRRIGLEEAGRVARYEFLERAADEIGADWIATAHTADDNVETILMNLSRGTGLKGLSGIPMVRGRVFRPLLEFTRSETRRYCESMGFECVDDPANRDLAFSRARIRMRVVPELLVIQPSLLQTVTRSAKLLGEEDRYLDSVAAAMLERCERRPNDRYTFLTDNEEAFFAREELVSYPSVLVRRGVRLVAQTLGAVPELDQVNLVLNYLRKGHRGSVTFSGVQVTVELGSQWVHFSTQEPLPSFRIPIEAGRVMDPDRRWCLSTTKSQTTEPIIERKSFVVRIDAERVCGNLYAAVGIRGLEYRPMGMAGHRSTSEILADLHLSKRAKGRVPIVCDMVGPLWVPGGPIADRVKITEATAATIELEFGPVSDDH